METTTLSMITFSTTDFPQKVEITDNVRKIILFLRDKITVFSDIPKFMAGQYHHLYQEYRPKIDLPEETNLVTLQKELIKYRQILQDDVEIGNFETLSDYLQKQTKEYKREFMPSLNFILFGYRSSPSLKELIEILGEEEIILRIDRGIAHIESFINQVRFDR